MNQFSPLSTTFGTYGWLAFTVAAVAVAIRLLKSDAANKLLATFSIPSIPKAWLPWLALVLGFAGNLLQARLGGTGWSDSALVGAWGLLGGGGAVAANEALAGAIRSVSPRVADIIFGRNAGPTLSKTAPTPAPVGSAAEAREVKAAVQVVAAAPSPAISEALHAVVVEATDAKTDKSA